MLFSVILTFFFASVSYKLTVLGRLCCFKSLVKARGSLLELFYRVREHNILDTYVLVLKFVLSQTALIRHFESKIWRHTRLLFKDCVEKFIGNFVKLQSFNFTRFVVRSKFLKST